MKSLIVGSAAGVLLFLSAISYSKTFIQSQDQKRVPQKSTQAESSSPTAAEANTGDSNSGTTAPVRTSDQPSANPPALNTAVENKVNDSPSERQAVVPPQPYTATAYSLHGRTSSGRPVNRGLIAADPSVLPLGTRIWLDAGSFSGEYVVGDTGGFVRGRRIDIWTPTPNEARRFGRRTVKLTVLSFGGKRSAATKSRPSKSSPAASSATTQKQ